MIRFVIGLFIFAVALCAYIVNLPRGASTTQRSLPVEQADVTRAGTPATAPLPTADAMTNRPTAPALGYATNTDPLGLTIANILKGLDLSTDSLGADARGATGPRSRLEMLILQSLQARTPDAKITAQLNTAARRGDVIVPDVLVRANGAIDVDTLLSAVVDHVMIAAGDQPVPAAALRDRPDLTWENGRALYRVTAKDSLAGLAQKFYGDVTRTDLILVANPEHLPSADLIAPGLTLVIPVI